MLFFNFFHCFVSWLLLVVRVCVCFFFSSRRRLTRCALVTGVQTCALPICLGAVVATFDNTRAGAVSATAYILVEIVEGQEFLFVGTRIPFGRNPPDVATAGYVDLVCARDLGRVDMLGKRCHGTSPCWKGLIRFGPANSSPPPSLHPGTHNRGLGPSARCGQIGRAHV